MRTLRPQVAVSRRLTERAQAIEPDHDRGLAGDESRAAIGPAPVGCGRRRRSAPRIVGLRAGALILSRGDPRSRSGSLAAVRVGCCAHSAPARGPLGQFANLSDSRNRPFGNLSRAGRTSDLPGNAAEMEAEDACFEISPRHPNRRPQARRAPVHRKHRSNEPNLPESARIGDSALQGRDLGNRWTERMIPMEIAGSEPVWEHEPDETRSDAGPALPGLAACSRTAESDRRPRRNAARRHSPVCSGRCARPRTRLPGSMRGPVRSPRRCAKGFAPAWHFQEAAGWLAHVGTPGRTRSTWRCATST